MQPSFFEIACSVSVMRRAFRIALVVGVILMGINHGDTILNGQMTLISWLKCALTFFVPYSVSTFSSVMAVRERLQVTEAQS